MKKKALLLAGLAAISSAAIVFASRTLNRDEFSSLIKENIELLAEDEDSKPTVAGHCEGNEHVECSIVCSGCGTWYYVKSKGGPAYNISGKCSCGSTEFEIGHITVQ